VASGNGGQHSDNCNYDGYANSIYTVTIGERVRLLSHSFPAWKNEIVPKAQNPPGWKLAGWWESVGKRLSSGNDHGGLQRRWPSALQSALRF